MREEFRPFENLELPKIPKGVVKGVLIGAAVILVLWGSFYQIPPEEIGVILRFGKFVRTSDPGLNLKLPFGIEKLSRVPVQRQLKEEFGFRTASAGIRSEFITTAATKEESIMLTGDLNVVDAEWIVQFKIREPKKFLFKMRSPIGTFRSMTEAVVRRVVGDSSVDEIVTIGRTRIASEAQALLQALCDDYENGIEVNQLIFQDVNPPESVRASFNDVNEALQEKERKINEAWAEYNNEIPKASGVALQMLEAAEGYATERINNAAGDARRFSAIYREYAKAPLVTRRRLYLEALNDILPKISKKVIVDENLKNLLPLLNLGQSAEVIK